MEALEIAAQQALDRVKGLTGKVDLARERLQGLRRQVEQAEGALDGDFQALSRQFESFLEVVETEKGRLDEEGALAFQAIGRLESAVEEAGPAASQAVQQETDGVESFGDEVEATGPEIAQRVEEARAAYEGLAQRTGALEQRLAQALGEARDFLQGEVVGGLQQMQEAVRERGAAVRAAVSACEADLEAASGKWSGGLGELRATLERAFAEVGQQAGSMVEKALSEVARAQADALEELAGQAGTLVEVLSRLGGAATGHGTRIAQAVASVEQQAGEAATGLETMDARLTEVRELLARLTFVSL